MFKVDAIQLDAQRLASAVAELRSLGLVVIDPADLDEATANTTPLVPVLAVAVRAAGDIARRARSLGMHSVEADMLVGCMERLERFIELIGAGQLAMVSLRPLDRAWHEEAGAIRKMQPASQAGAPR